MGTFEEAENWSFNPFDLTKVWPHSDFPLIPVGRITLNRNPRNYFAEVEQIAFSPAHLVPGIEPSPDKMLQGRLFSYNDTHRHRLGTNFFSGPRDGKQFLESKFSCPSKDVGRYNSAEEDNFTQCGIFFRDVLNSDEKFRLVDNIASHIINAQEFLQERAVKQFGCADPEYGRMLRERINYYKNDKAMTNGQPM